MEKIWVGEYNVEQKVFHIDTLDKSCQTNEARLTEWGSVAWIPFCYGKSNEEVRKNIRKKTIELYEKGDAEGDKNKYISEFLTNYSLS